MAGNNLDLALAIRERGRARKVVFINPVPRFNTCSWPRGGWWMATTITKAGQFWLDEINHLSRKALPRRPIGKQPRPAGGLPDSMNGCGWFTGDVLRYT